MPTASCLASSSSTEISGSRAASSGVHHRPAMTLLRPGGADAHVRTYSRVRNHGSSRRVRTSAGSGSPSIAERRERTTGISSGGVPPSPATSCAKAGAWSGCTSMKKKAGALSALLVTSCSRRLDSRSATATISITARPSETSTAGAWLPGRWRLAAPCRQASERHRPRRASATTSRAPSAKRQERADQPAEEDPADLPRARLPEREPGEAGRDGDQAEPRPPPAQDGLDVAPQDQRGRNPSDLEQRPEGEEQGDADAHREAPEDGERRDAAVEGDRQEPDEEGRQERLQGAAEDGAEQAAAEPEERGLEQVDGEHLPGGRAEALEDGDRARASAGRRRARSRRRRFRPP